jgi:hypothetical protein
LGVEKKSKPESRENPPVIMTIRLGGGLLRPAAIYNFSPKFVNLLFFSWILVFV